ncbi:MAG: thiamine phosphate synthase, partial [Firmicutes bacterium]|nr:thiamine phosphate synthase [Bacillota bacterium]
RTKKDVCDPVGLEYLEYVVKNVSLPFVAIGGIKEHNIRQVTAIKIRQVKENFYLVGDRVSEVQPHCPAMAPGVVITAAKQADVVLSYFLGTAGEIIDR